MVASMVDVMAEKKAVMRVASTVDMMAALMVEMMVENKAALSVA